MSNCPICGKRSKGLCFKCATKIGTDIVFIEKSFFSFHKKVLLVPFEEAENLFNFLWNLNAHLKDKSDDERKETVNKELDKKIHFLNKTAFSNILSLCNDATEIAYL